MRGLLCISELHLPNCCHSPLGEWKVIMYLSGNQAETTLKAWKITFYGTAPELAAHECPAGQFLDSTHTCQHCHVECNTDGCFGPAATQCHGCLHANLGGTCVETCPKFQSNVTCVDQCPPNTAPSTERVCVTCHSECKGGCTGPDATSCNDCLNYKLKTAAGLLECVFACPPSHVFNSKTRICSCADGYYEDFAGFCQQCHPQCVSCIGPEPSHCKGNCRNFQLHFDCVATCPEMNFISTDVGFVVADLSFIFLLVSMNTICGAFSLVFVLVSFTSTFPMPCCNRRSSVRAAMLLVPVGALVKQPPTASTEMLGFA